MFCSKPITKIAVVVLLTTFAASARAASVVSVIPPQNETDVSAAADISVTFDANMDAASINDSTFNVYSMYNGPQSGTISYDNPTRTATFDPANDFSAGDVVTVMLTIGVRTESEAALDDSFGWMFTVAVGSGGGYFTIETTVATGSLPHGVIGADLNGDSHLDLATANFGSNNVTILLNNGDGSFTGVEYPAGAGVRLLCAGDLDGDDDLDLATANGSESSVSVLINNGDGTFESPTEYESGASPHSVVAVDLNGDGYLDLATANEGTHDVSVLINNGDGTFGAHTAFGVGDVPRSVAAGDFNGDGCFDLATANKSSNTASVLLNNGDGTFTTHTEFPIGEHPRGICVADLDGDGHLDLVTANELSHDISLLLGAGDGSFATQETFSAIGGPYAVLATDLNTDGAMDIVTANVNGTAGVLYNNGDGTFAATIHHQVSNGLVAICAGDLDGDNDLELATADFFDHTVSILNDVPLPLSNILTFPAIAGQTCGSCEIGHLEQPVACLLSEPATGATVSVAIPENVEVCGVSFDGLLTESWDFKDAIIKQDSGFLTVFLTNSSGYLIPAGPEVTLFNMQFSAPSQCMDNHNIRWDTALSADPSRATKFSDTLFGTFVPLFDVNQSFSEVLGFQPGNIDNDPVMDIGDVTTLIQSMFITLGPLCNVNAADINGDCAGPDIGDLTLLINRLFINFEQELSCGCIGEPGAPAKIAPEIFVSADYTDGVTTIILNSPRDLRGLQLQLRGAESVAPTLLSKDKNLDIVHGWSDDILKLAVLDMEGLTMIQSGESRVVELQGEYEIVSAVVSDSKHQSSTPVVTDAIKPSALPTKFELSQNYPNPFNPATEIEFALPQATEVNLIIYNVMGQVVATIAEGQFDAGYHTLRWDGSNHASGVYLYRLEAGSFVQTRKMILLK